MLYIICFFYWAIICSLTIHVLDLNLKTIIGIFMWALGQIFV